MDTNVKLRQIVNNTFKDNDFETRIKIYFSILSEAAVKSSTELLNIVKEKYPDDTSVNQSRVERDFKKFVDEMELPKDGRPIVAIKQWMKKYNIDTKMKDMFCHVIDFSKCDMGVFFKTEPYQAELFGQTIRQAFESSHCFVISDYDTVFVHFGTKETYTDFLNICRQFVPRFKMEGIPESR